jgi:hypothetical protein
MRRQPPIGVGADPASTTRTDQVRALNDAFRRSFTGGHVMLSRGIATLPEDQRREGRGGGASVRSLQHSEARFEVKAQALSQARGA